MKYTIEQLVEAWGIDTEKAQKIANEAESLGISMDGRDGVKKLNSLQRDIWIAKGGVPGSSGKTRVVYVPLNEQQVDKAIDKLKLPETCKPAAISSSGKIKDIQGKIWVFDTEAKAWQVKESSAKATLTPEQKAESAIDSMLGKLGL